MPAKIAIFYHMARMGSWREVDKEIVDALGKSGLLDRSNVFMTNMCMDISLFEFPTLEMLHEFSKNNPNYYVLYIHTKGVTNEKSLAIADWRACMLHYNVTLWRDCVQKLTQGFDTCGINIMKTPHPHYQGNFWWAKASYVRTLFPVRDTPVIPNDTLNFGERHKCEMWLLQNKGRAACLYHHNINPYLKRNPSSNWKKR